MRCASDEHPLAHSDDPIYSFLHDYHLDHPHQNRKKISNDLRETIKILDGGENISWGRESTQNS